jgi:hemolysin activation/secretion protein
MAGFIAKNKEIYALNIFRRVFRLALAGLILAGLSIFSASGLAMAQRPMGIPNAGSISQEALRARPNPEPKREDPVLPEEISPSFLEESNTGESKSGAILVRDFKLDKLAYLDEAEVQAALKPFKGKTLTPAQLKEALDEVKKLYRQKGYMAVEVYSPKANPEDGVVVVRSKEKK